MKRLFFTITASICLSQTASADIFDNVYYKLYQTRLDLTKVQISKQIATAAQDKRMYMRYKKLRETNSISEVAFEEYRLKHDLSKLHLEDLKVKKAEAQAMLDIATDRIQLGLDMPICPGLSE